MASITKKVKQDGSASYLIRVCSGRTQSGAQRFKNKTVTPPAGMTAKKAEKWVEEQAARFEQEVQKGILIDDSMTLDDLMDRFFEEYAEKQLRAKTVLDYQLMRPRISAALGHMKVARIKPTHIMAFYNNLEEEGVRQDSTYTATAALLKKLPRGKRTEIAQAAGIGQETMRLVYAGHTVSRRTAEKVSAAVGLAFSKAFTEHAREGGKLSGNTVKHYHAMLSSVFKKGVQWGALKENPCVRAEHPKAEEVDVQSLEEMDVAKLLVALQDAPVQYSVITQLALFTGARRGEICGLRWSDIDFEAGTISINRTLLYMQGRGSVFNPPKTRKSKRVVKVGRDCLALLSEYRQHQKAERFKVGSEWVKRIEIENGKTVPNDLLFTKWNGGPLDPNKITTWFPKFLVEHDLPPVHFHSLRHTNASLLISAHTPITTVSGRLGHAQTSTTLNIYASAIQSADAAAADALESIFDRLREQNHA